MPGETTITMTPILKESYGKATYPRHTGSKAIRALRRQGVRRRKPRKGR